MREGLLQRMTTWLLVWGLAILAPLLLFDQLLSEAIEARQRNRLDEARERASAAMTTLEEHLDRTHLLTDALHRLLRRWPSCAAATLATANGKIAPEAAKRFLRIFRRQFPASSSMYWFDVAGSWVPIDLSSPPDGIRVWQSIFRLADAPRRVAPLDRRLAENFLLTRLGPLAKPSLIERLPEEPLEILLRGRPHLLAFFRLPPVSPGQPSLGSLLILLPLFEAAPGWELRLAARRLSRGDLTIGGIRLSDNRTVGRWPLDPGMLHGLSSHFRAGEPLLEHHGHLFLTRASTHDPDLLLSVATRLESDSTEGNSSTLVHLRKGIALALFLTGFLAIGFAASGWRACVSLRGKIMMGTALLAGLPLLAMLMFGLQHLALLERHRFEQLQQSLQDRIDRFDQEIGEAQIKTRNRIRNLTALPVFQHCRNQREIRRLLAGLIPEFGLKRVFLWHQNGTTIRWGWTSQADRRMMGFQFEMIRESLRRMNMESNDKIDIPPGVSSEAAMLFRGMGMDNSMNAMKGLDGLNRLRRLEALQFGSTGWFFYQDFLTDPVTKRCLGYFNLIFDRSRLLRTLTAKARENLPTDAIRVAWQPAESRQRESRRFSARLIAKARRHSGLVHEIQEHQSGNSIGFARPSKGFPIIAASIARVHQDDPHHRHMIEWLGIMLGLALGGALSATFLAGRFLLEPVQELKNALSAVGAGEFPRLQRLESGDELGKIADRYHQMVHGLEEKARMSRFLRSDLAGIGRGKDPQEQVIERRQAVLLFAGLRDFSLFERDVPPEAAMGLMNTFLGIVEERVKAHGGEIDKFIGDTAMAVFLETPTSIMQPPTAPRKAINAALDIFRAFSGSDGQALPLAFGIGLAGGSVVTGPIGSEKRRLDFTVIGDPVNLAARLEKMAGRDDLPPILADVSVRREVEIEWRELPITSVRGKAFAIRVFTPCPKEPRSKSFNRQGDDHG